MKIVASICFLIGVIFLVKRNYYIKTSKNENCESDKYSMALGCCAVGFEAVGLLCLLLSL